MVAPPWYAVPPPAYGGVEMLVAGLADGLVAQGHEVLLVSAGPNGTLSSGVTTLAQAADDRLGDEVTSLLHAALAEDAVRSFAPDVVHDHTIPGLLAAEHRRCPTIATVHGRPAGDLGELLKGARHARLVAISHAQQRSASDIPWHAVVHNGIPVRAYPFSDAKDDYLFFLGRLDPDKGVVQAIEVAERSGSNLLIAARIHGREEERFFEEVVRPRLSESVEFVGEIGYADKVRLLSSARALIFPLQWEEPYGLVVAEAQACGTPVLSLRRGAIPELVVDGRTGWLRDHHLQLVDAVDRLPELAPRSCRAHALESLDIDRCVRGYEQVFSHVVEAASQRSARHRDHVVALNGPLHPTLVGPINGSPDPTVRVSHLLTKESS